MEYIYYIQENNETSQPLSFEELKAKRISEQTYVWRKGLKDWVKALELKELENIIIFSPPEIPKTNESFNIVDNNFEKISKNTKSFLDFISISNFISSIWIAVIGALILLFSLPSIYYHFYVYTNQNVFETAYVEPLFMLSNSYDCNDPIITLKLRDPKKVNNIEILALISIFIGGIVFFYGLKHFVKKIDAPKKHFLKIIIVLSFILSLSIIMIGVLFVENQENSIKYKEVIELLLQKNSKAEFDSGC
jgi:hypothetical protein